MKIALAVEGTRGDVYPMLALAARIEAAGHDAVVVAPPEFAEVAEQRGIAFRGAGNDIRSYLTEHADVITRRSPSAIRIPLEFARTSIERQFATVPEATSDADLIVGAGVQFAGSSAAELHGVPYRYVMYCPAMLPSPEHAPALVGVAGLPRWLNRALWWAMDRWALPALGRQLDEPRARLGLPPIHDLPPYQRQHDKDSAIRGIDPTKRGFGLQCRNHPIGDQDDPSDQAQQDQKQDQNREDPGHP